MDKPTLGLEAENYAKQGWEIFPCKPRDKTPMTAHGLKDATTNLNTIRRWWAQTPDANIGLNCGKSGLVVIDLDKRADADGLAEWGKLIAEHQLQPKTATSLTGGGGRHLLFKLVGDMKIRNSASRLAPGIDVRGEGGYIVLPPSIHPSGKPYCWADGATTIEPIPEIVARILTTEPDPWKIYTLRDAWQPRPPMVWLVDKVVPMGSLSVWFGAPGSLKSMILADLALCVAAGRPWLTDPQGTGGYATQASAVMWLDFDNGQRRTHERFQALSKAHDVPQTTPLYYVSMPDPYLDAGDTAAMGALAQRIVDRDVSLVIIDNLGLIKGAADENTDQMQEPLKGLRWLTEATGAALCVIHHQRKANGFNARAGESLRGHSSIESALDLAVHVERDDLNITIASTKDRGMRVAPFGAVFSYQNDTSHELVDARFWPADPITEETEAVSRKAIIEQEAIETIRKHGTLSANQVYDIIKGNRAEVLDVLRGMAQRGTLGQKQASRGYILYLPGDHPELVSRR